MSAIEVKSNKLMESLGDFGNVEYHFIATVLRSQMLAPNRVLFMVQIELFDYFNWYLVELSVIHSNTKINDAKLNCLKKNCLIICVSKMTDMNLIFSFT